MLSSATKTARVAELPVNASGVALATISGDITVERFISAKRAWRFLAVPTNSPTQTFHQAWQENQAPLAVGAIGYGTQVTHNIAGWAAAGFDYFSPDGPSVKKWDPINKTYLGILNTSQLIATTEGLMTFVRGDRRAIGLGATPTTTILRTSGPLKMGNQTTISIPTGKIISVGNPYASPIDMRKIAAATNSTFFYLYNPNLTGSSGLGAFETFSYANGNYTTTPGTGAAHNYIQSGQGFFVQLTGDVAIKESSKAGVSEPLVFRPVNLPDAQLRTNLYAVEPNNNVDLLDGILTEFSDSYSNAVDKSDAKKMTNVSENLSVKTDTNLLVIERRHTISQSDTIHLYMLKMKAKSYRFEILGDHFNQPGLVAFLEDDHLKSSTALNINGANEYNFNVLDVPASYNPSRFKIVFKQAAALPVIFNLVKAYEIDKDIAVEWTVENESNASKYAVEKSTDGIHFLQVATVDAKGTNSGIQNYKWIDTDPYAGNNYYRIVSINDREAKEYSKAVKVVIQRLKSQITVYPNPITHGIINLKLINEPAGNYELRLFNKLGQVVSFKQYINARNNDFSTVEINIKALAHGAYQLEITKPGKIKTNIKLLY